MSESKYAGAEVKVVGGEVGRIKGETAHGRRESRVSAKTGF